jgi:hypothetical protein
LVGLIRTRSPGITLSDSDKIIWGEITYHGEPIREYKMREDGKVAVNISTIVDCDTEYFTTNSYITLIDCMTFVPEWIPCLKAIEKQKQSILPFDDGRYLNIGLPMSSKWDTETATMVSNTPRSSLMASIVEESNLEPIRELRRDDGLKKQLVDGLQRLVEETTLDSMQLESFCNSLREPVHLTQGPPGM